MTKRFVLCLVLSFFVAELSAQTCTLPTPETFVRGDANNDGIVNISDPSYMVGVLFNGYTPPPALDALDANDDGLTDLSDATYLNNYLYLGGAAPPPPFKNSFGAFAPGFDPTLDHIDTFADLADPDPCSTSVQSANISDAQGNDPEGHNCTGPVVTPHRWNSDSMTPIQTGCSGRLFAQVRDDSCSPCPLENRYTFDVLYLANLTPGADDPTLAHLMDGLDLKFDLDFTDMQALVMDPYCCLPQSSALVSWGWSIPSCTVTLKYDYVEVIPGGLNNPRSKTVTVPLNWNNWDPHSNERTDCSEGVSSTSTINDHNECYFPLTDPHDDHAGVVTVPSTIWEPLIAELNQGGWPCSDIAQVRVWVRELSVEFSLSFAPSAGGNRPKKVGFDLTAEMGNPRFE